MGEEIPPEVWDGLVGVGLAAGGANVVMQLSRLPVGHGVARSTVDSGRVDKHPIKRGRTTTAYLAVAMLGTEDERLAMRREIARAHKPVHSDPSDPVQYDAFDPELQLWVAACLYWGAADIYIRLRGQPDAATRAALYEHSKRLGTTLQVSDEMWPADVEAFDRYWEERITGIEMDELTRNYLRGIADFSFLVAPLGALGVPLRLLLRPVGRFITLGFLPEPFRRELGLPWTDRLQARHDAAMRAVMAIARILPRPLRVFPINAYLWDTRRRLRLGRSIV